MFNCYVRFAVTCSFLWKQILISYPLYWYLWYYRLQIIILAKTWTVESFRKAGTWAALVLYASNCSWRVSWISLVNDFILHQARYRSPLIAGSWLVSWINDFILHHSAFIPCARIISIISIYYSFGVLCLRVRKSNHRYSVIEQYCNSDNSICIWLCGNNGTVKFVHLETIVV
jgi:hypothetical protein